MSFVGYKLGKQKAVLDTSTKKLTLPIQSIVKNVPDNLNWINDVQWPMWCNDTIGCCTQVSVASAIRTWSFISSKEILLTNEIVIKNYSDESGYDPSNPSTDQGAVETQVLKRWCNTGYQTPTGINKLIDFGYINPRDKDSIKRTIFLLGGLYIGISVPRYALMVRNQIWDVENTNASIAGGHAIYLHGYDDDYLYLNTWGSEWKMTWDFMAKYCDEAYGLVSETWLNSNNESPLGEDIKTLIQELNSITG